MTRGVLERLFVPTVHMQMLWLHLLEVTTLCLSARRAACLPEFHRGDPEAGVVLCLSTCQPPDRLRLRPPCWGEERWTRVTRTGGGGGGSQVPGTGAGRAQRHGVGVVGPSPSSCRASATCVQKHKEVKAMAWRVPSDLQGDPGHAPGCRAPAGA